MALRRADDPEAVAFGQLARFLGYNLRRAQLAAFESFARAALPYDVSPVEFSVMLLIEANPGIKQTTLASALGVERFTMVRLVDRLVGIDLVKRGSSEADRRIAPPELTANGRAAIATIGPRVRAGDAELSAHLSAPERATLGRLLRKLNRIE